MNELDAATRAACTDRPATPGKAHVSKGPGPALMGATTLVGDEVCDLYGNRLGELKEIMLDARSGRIVYAVLSCGSHLHPVSKLFAVPWRALRLDTANRRFVLDVDKDLLASEPGFDPDRWPDTADSIWAKQIHAYHGTTPYYDRPLRAG